MPNERTNQHEDIERITELLRAMGDPSRLRLLRALDQGEACVGELAQSTGLSNANTSKHLSVLRQVGLVAYTRMGNSKCFALTSTMVSEVCRTVTGARRND